MLLVLLVGGTLSWMINRARSQRLAVAAILQAGGWVQFNTQTPTQISAPPPPSPVPTGQTPLPDHPRGSNRVARWLRANLGDDLFDTATEVFLTNSPLDDSLMRHVGSLPHLNSLHLTNCLDPGAGQLTRVGYSQIARLPDLQDLWISGTSSSDGFLPYLGGLTQLRGLMIPEAHPTNSDLSQMADLTNLEGVAFDASQLPDAGFAVVAKWKRLVSLSVTNCQVSDLSPLNDHPDLEVIVLTRPDLAEPNQTPLSLEPFRHCPELRQLVMSGFLLDASGIKPILNLRKLEFLVADGNTISHADLAGLAKISSLIRLDLHHAPIRTLEPLGPLLPTLGCLKIVDSPLTDEGISCLRTCSLLNTLDLSRSAISDAGLTTIALLPGINVLDLRSTEITDAGLGPLRTLTLLKLDVSGTQITDAGLAQIVTQWPFLKDLDLGNTMTTDAGLDSLAKLRSLQRVGLIDTKTTVPGRDRLRKARSALKISLQDRPEW